MALVNCPECNKEIANDAQQCPNCGHPFNNEEIVVKKQPIPARNYGWGTFLYLIIILAGLFMLFEGKLTGLILLIIGVGLVIGRYMLWAQTDKKIR